ncbi:MAG: guanylate kinase [Psychromonas sp.]|nr:guanylate kinase [Psychromonas sp.]
MPRCQLGTLYFISAPSGAGKSSLITAVLKEEREWNTQVSVSHTTRQPRSSEINGLHYHFVTVDKFNKLIQQDVFFEWAEVFGHYYGTSRVTIEKALEQGIDVILDIDWQGARQVRKFMPQAKGIFILPPNKKELEKRLNKRGQDSPDIIKERMLQARYEMSHYDEYDYLIVNHCFKQATKEFSAIMQAVRNEQEHQAYRHEYIIKDLLGK